MFGFPLIQVVGAAIMLCAGVVMAWPKIGPLIGSFGPSSGSDKPGGLSEGDLRRADGLCFELAAIARRSGRAEQRKAILDSVHTIEGALTLEPAPVAAWGNRSGDQAQQQQNRAAP